MSSYVNAANLAEVQEYERQYKLGSQSLVSKNYEKAFVHLDKASKLGNKSAQYSLALLYMEGQGTQQNYAQAYVWLNVAAEANDKKWRKMRDKIQNALTKEQQESLQASVDAHMGQYGATAQEVSCKRVTKARSRSKYMQCTKKLDAGLEFLESRIQSHSRPGSTN
jgi:TPR repeat protein